MEPVLLDQDAPAAHDYGQPLRAVRIRKRFDAFAELPHAVGNITRGPGAEVHGHTWKLAICPGGSKEENKDYLSVFLELREPFPEAGVKADVTLRLINHAGEADDVGRLEHARLELGALELEGGDHEGAPLQRLEGGRRGVRTQLFLRGDSVRQA